MLKSVRRRWNLGTLCPHRPWRFGEDLVKWYISSGSRKQKSIFLIEDINSYQLAVLTI